MKIFNYLITLTSLTILWSCGDADELIENTAPVISDQSFMIDENSAEGTVVGQITASDADGDSLTFTMNDASGTFTLSTDGKLTVAKSENLDFETTAAYEFDVTVKDAETSVSATVTVTVVDIAENVLPTIADQTFEIAEDASVGTVVGQVVFEDADGDNLSITSADTTFFSLSSAGELTVKSKLDYETTTSHTMSISVSDNIDHDGDGTADLVTVTLTINVTDIEELAPNTVKMGEQVYSVVGTWIESYGKGDPAFSGTKTHISTGISFYDAAIVPTDDDPFNGPNYAGPDNASVGGWMELHYAGDEHFKTGTYDHFDLYGSDGELLDNIDASGDVFELTFITGFDSVNEKYYVNKSGSVTLSGSAGNYLVEMDLVLFSPEDSDQEISFKGSFTISMDPIPAFVDEEIEISTAPTFSVQLPDTLADTYVRSPTWTGSELWVTTVTYDGATDELVYHIGNEHALAVNVANGDLVEGVSLSENFPIDNIHYEDGSFWSIVYGSYSKVDIAANEVTEQLASSNGYNEAFWVYDGEDFHTDESGNYTTISTSGIKTVYTDYETPNDLVFGDGHFWALQVAGEDSKIIKLDKDLDRVKVYGVPNLATLNEDAWHEIQIVLINGELWVYDGINNFYNTGLK
ncbi:MAG: cadherin repeat domain-containing protein [Cyclobacteriaceae bacterium]